MPVWGSEQIVAYSGQAQSVRLGRAIPGRQNRIHFFYALTPGGFIQATPDLGHRTLKTDGTMSLEFIFAYTGLTGYTALFPVGDYARINIYAEAGKIAVPVIRYDGTVYMFDDSDQLGNPVETAMGAPLVFQDVLESGQPMITIRWVGAGQLRAMLLPLSLSSPTWATYKFFCDGAFKDTGTYGLQAGPVMAFGQYSQQMGAHIYNVGNQVMIATFVKCAVTGGVKFEILRARDLPTADTYMLSDWIADNP